MTTPREPAETPKRFIVPSGSPVFTSTATARPGHDRRSVSGAIHRLDLTEHFVGEALALDVFQRTIELERSAGRHDLGFEARAALVLLKKELHVDLVRVDAFQIGYDFPRPTARAQALDRVGERVRVTAERHGDRVL